MSCSWTTRALAEAAGGKVAMNLTNSESAETSPGGDTILFGSNRYRPRPIWSMNHDGTNAHNVTNANGFSGQGRWSPDGIKIVFESEREWQRELYVMNRTAVGRCGSRGIHRFSTRGETLRGFRQPLRACCCCHRQKVNWRAEMPRW